MSQVFELPVQTRPVAHSHGDLSSEGLLAFDDSLPGPLPVVLIAPTIRGRTEFEEGKARALAELGYAGLVIDLYGVETRNAGIETYRELMNGLKADRPALQQRLLDWLETSRKLPEVDPSRVAAMGFCFGGLCVLDLARTGADIAGVAAFHGLLDPPGNTGNKRIKARVLAMHGWDDPLAPPDKVLALAKELTDMGADWQIHAYGNTLHAFTNPAANEKSAGTVYDRNADRRSWSTLQDFLSELF